MDIFLGTTEYFWHPLLQKVWVVGNGKCCVTVTYTLGHVWKCAAMKVKTKDLDLLLQENDLLTISKFHVNIILAAVTRDDL